MAICLSCSTLTLSLLPVFPLETSRDHSHLSAPNTETSTHTSMVPPTITVSTTPDLPAGAPAMLEGLGIHPTPLLPPSHAPSCCCSPNVYLPFHVVLSYIHLFPGWCLPILHASYHFSLVGQGAAKSRGHFSEITVLFCTWPCAHNIHIICLLASFSHYSSFLRVETDLFMVAPLYKSVVQHRIGSQILEQHIDDFSTYIRGSGE